MLNSLDMGEMHPTNKAQDPPGDPVTESLASARPWLAIVVLSLTKSTGDSIAHGVYGGSHMLCTLLITVLQLARLCTGSKTFK